MKGVFFMFLKKQTNNNHNRIIFFLIFLLITLLLLTSCLTGFYQTALDYENSRNWEKAVDYYYLAINDFNLKKYHEGYRRALENFLNEVDQNIKNIIIIDDYFSYNKSNINSIEKNFNSKLDKLKTVSNNIVESKNLVSKLLLTEEELKSFDYFYLNFLNKIIAINENIRNKKNKISDINDKLIKYTEEKISEAKKYIENKDSAKGIDILESVIKYEFSTEIIDKIKNSCVLVNEGNKLLKEKNADEAYNKFLEAKKEFEFKIYDEYIRIAANIISERYYSQGKNILDSTRPDDINKIKEALNNFKKIMEYSDNYKNTKNYINFCIKLLTDRFIINAKNYERRGKWGNAILERYQTLFIDDKSESAQNIKNIIENDKKNLLKDKSLRLLIIPNQEEGDKEVILSFYGNFSKVFKEDICFTGQKWNIVNVNTLSFVTDSLQRAHYDISKLSNVDRKLFDQILIITVASIQPDVPNPEYNDREKEFIERYKKVHNVAWDTWKSELNNLVISANYATTNFEKAFILAAIVTKKASEPPREIDEPVYNYAAWTEINWYVGISIDVQCKLLEFKQDGEVEEIDLPYYDKVEDRCTEIKPRRFCDKVGIYSVPKKLKSVSDLKQELLQNIIEKIKYDISNKLLQRGYDINCSRAKLCNSNKDYNDYLEYLMYLHFLYDLNITSDIESVRQGYKLWKK